ncbi:thioredoxin family protein [Microbaculum marinum]|uniref:Thioredoxin family protein n=1 Tax=Microbaculum marinum TaxID=1764581 RepID=A0AAW9S131_9HYPH
MPLNTANTVVSREEWLQARKRLLAEEKAFTRQRDALAEARRKLPWERVGTDYTFEGPDGPVRLADLFDDRRQLLVYHFMFAPDWETGCKSCSFWADNFNGIVAHLRQRDVSFVAISRAPLAKLQALAGRMGWSFPWVSSGENGFNRDFAVSFTQDEVESQAPVYNYGTSRTYGIEMPGVSVFYKDDDGAIYHTYSAYMRGIDILNTAYNYLDLLPKGRDEDDLPYTMAWVRLRDEYAA